MDRSTKDKLSRLPKELQDICSDGFALQLAALSALAAIKWVVRRTREYQSLKTAFQQGTVEEHGIRRTVSLLLEDFRAGMKFEHEAALIALAVLFEEVSSIVGEEFLKDLSRVRLAELQLASLVAQQSLQSKRTSAHIRFRTYPCSQPPKFEIISPPVPKWAVDIGSTSDVFSEHRGVCHA